METPIFDGKDAEWYSSVMPGYIVTASALSIALSLVMASGVV